MADLKQRFDSLSRTGAPDLWPDIERREPRLVPPEPRGHRVVTVIVALAVAVAGFAFAEWAFRSRQPQTPPLSPGPPVLHSNGEIAFVRTDPKYMVKEPSIAVSAIYAVEPNGTGLVKLAEGVIYRSTPAWSPDGSRLAFLRANGIYLMNPDGSGAVKLVGCEPPECEGQSDPTWSPDGTRLVFTMYRNEAGSLWVVGADGSSLAPLTKDLGSIGSPTWSPDGRQIAVTLGHVPGGTVILLVSAETGEVVRSITPSARIEVAGPPAWSPDGDWFVFDASGLQGSWRRSGIYVMRTDGTDLRLLTSCRAASSGCGDVYPAWSPDGREIVFTRSAFEWGTDGFTGDLFVIDLQGGERRRLTSGPGLDCCAAWQPLPPAAASVPPTLDGLDAQEVAVYEAVVRSLAEFPKEGTVFIFDHLCTEADKGWDAGDCTSMLSEEEQAALLHALSDWPSVKFVSQTRQLVKDIFNGKVHGTLIRLGPIAGSGDKLTVPASEYCGGLCGAGGVWVVEQGPNGWSVTGSVGGTWIS